MKMNLADLVASSMQEIVDSDEHKKLFKKEAAKKSCCPDCKKCGTKCVCKGKCKGCKNCPSKDTKKPEVKKPEAKKTTKKASIDADQVNEIIELLVRASELQDELGLVKSAVLSGLSVQEMMDELSKQAGTGETDKVERMFRKNPKFDDILQGLDEDETDYSSLFDDEGVGGENEGIGEDSEIPEIPLAPSIPSLADNKNKIYDGPKTRRPSLGDQNLINPTEVDLVPPTGSGNTQLMDMLGERTSPPEEKPFDTDIENLDELINDEPVVHDSGDVDDVFAAINYLDSFIKSAEYGDKDLASPEHVGNFLNRMKFNAEERQDHGDILNDVTDPEDDQLGKLSKEQIDAMLGNDPLICEECLNFGSDCVCEKKTHTLEDQI